MEQIKTLPIIDTAEPMVGCNMHDTIDIIYSKYAKSINIKKFLPVLPTQVDGIPIGLSYNLELDMYDFYKFVKFKVFDLVIICIIMKKEITFKKTNRSVTKYHIRCLGTNNTVNILDVPFGFEITSRSNQIDSRGIGKSTLPGLEQGSVVTKTSNALMEYFQPNSFTRIDAAEITCKNGTTFYLSWLRLLTKPTDTADLSWYNSFGLKRVSPHVSNKQKLADTIDRVKHITAKELEDYYEKVNDLFSTEKYKSVHVGTYIPEGYFIYVDTDLIYKNYIFGIIHPRETYKKSLEIVKKVSSSTTLSEILQDASCEDRASLINTLPIRGSVFAGFHDTELKKDAIFPQLKDIMTLWKYMIWNTRVYSFKHKKRSACKSKTQKKKRT